MRDTVYRKFVQGDDNEIFECRFENGLSKSWSSFDALLKFIRGRAKEARTAGYSYAVSLTSPSSEIQLPHGEPASIYQELLVEDRKRLWDMLRQIPVSF